MVNKDTDRNKPAQIPEQTSRATQQNRDRERPPHRAGQLGKDVGNDSSNQHFGLSDTERTEIPDDKVANQDPERVRRL